MSQVDSTVVRQAIEEHEPIRDIELNFLLCERGVDPFDAIVLQDILEEQDRIEYDTDARFFFIQD